MFYSFLIRSLFSLSSPCSTNSVTSPLLIFFFFLRCTQTHPHRKINTEIHLLKKKKIEIHKHTHTNKPKHTNNKETDRYLSEQSVFDRCLTGTIGAHESCLIEANGSHLIGARGYGSCLIRARQIGACGSELWIGAAVDWSCGSKLWIGACDWSSDVCSSDLSKTHELRSFQSSTDQIPIVSISTDLYLCCLCVWVCLCGCVCVFLFLFFFLSKCISVLIFLCGCVCVWVCLCASKEKEEDEERRSY